MHVLNMALNAAAPMIGVLHVPMADPYIDTMPEAKAALPSGRGVAVRCNSNAPMVRNPMARTTEIANPALNSVRVSRRVGR